MALNPLISLQAYTPDLGQTIGNALTNAAGINQMRENRQMAPVRSQLALGEADIARLKSAAITAGQIIPMLESNDIEGARTTLTSRRDQLKKLGLETADLDQGLMLLDKDPAILKQRATQVLQTLGALEGKGKGAPGFTEANQLRTQFLGQTKDFATQSDALGRIISSAEDPSAAGDLSLIFAYMKILDPGSTVREGEFANAENSAGIPGRIRSMYNKVLSGERLNEDQRTDFVDRAFRLYEGSKEGYDARVSSYTDIASRAGLNPQDVIQAQPDIFGGKYQETRDRLTKRKQKAGTTQKAPPAPDAPIEDIVNYYNQNQ